MIYQDVNFNTKLFNMIKFVLTNLIATILFSVANAQQNQGPGNSTIHSDNYIQKATTETNRMATALQLSQSQKDKVLSVNIKFFRDVLEIKNSDLNNPSLKKQKMDKLNDDRLKDIKNELTVNQYNQYISHIDSVQRRLLPIQPPASNN